MTQRIRSLHVATGTRSFRSRAWCHSLCACALLALVATTFSPEEARAQTACAFTDDFERATGNVVGNGWVESGGAPSAIAIEFDGVDTYCLLSRNNVSITQSLIDTTGLTGITFDYDWRDNGATDAGDSLIVQWKPSADGTFITLATHVLTQATFLSESHALPATAENTTIDIRFLTAVAANSDGAHVDNVAVCCPDADGDGTCDADDICPGFDDNLDADGDGVPDGCDICPGFDDTLDADGDGVPDGCDICPGFDDNLDADGDNTPDGCDGCPADPAKIAPGVCGCGTPDTDSDGDAVPDCNDVCPGFDDNLDADGDNTPDGCDICPGSDDSLDADGDGVPDGCDICPGSDDNLDADGDGVPDGCDICPGSDDNLDADGDGVPDGCDGCPADPAKITPGVCGCGTPDTDSDGDAVPDCNDICPGFDDNLDADGDGVPDGCDICPGSDDNLDADGDNTPDGCDGCPNEPALVNPSEPGLEVTCADTIDNDCDGQTDAGDSDCVFVDCNANGTNDSHDIFFGTSTDCNTSGTPDECEIETNLSDASGPLTPLGTSTPQAFTIVSAPVAIGDVVLNFEASANLNAPTDNVAVDINGTAVGVIYGAAGVFLCQVPPSTDQLIVPAATYNAAVGGGNAVINMVPSLDVGDGACNNLAFISVSVDYPVVAGLPDCNGNGTLDECELALGTAQDCDTNGVPDDCQPDTDGDGAIDPCDACPYLCGDINGSGTAVDLLDFSEFSLCFGLFGPDAQCDATSYACSNFNVDDRVNLLDFATFALLFGLQQTVSVPNCAGGP